jgi:hypothetical protein
MCRSIRVHIQTEARFSRRAEDPNQMMYATGFFNTSPQDLNAVQELDLGRVQDELLNRVENWNSQGSGFSLENIVKFTVCITVNTPLVGSNYIPTPKVLQHKHALVNVQNDDERCFLWSILAALFPVTIHPERVNHYRPYLDTLKTDGLTFPLPVEQVAAFEILNPDISVNVLLYDTDNRTEPNRKEPNRTDSRTESITEPITEPKTEPITEPN